MTPQEFKAWFDGFSEGIDGNPTVKQWEKICQKVKAVDGSPIPQQVIHEYVRDWRPLYARPHYGSWLGVSVSTQATCQAKLSAVDPSLAQQAFSDDAAWQLNTVDALKQMGRDDLATC